MEFSSLENPPGGGAELGTSLPASPPAPVYADRSTGLLIFGILEIIGGALAFFAIPLMLLGLVLGRRAGGATPASSFVTLPLTYGALAAVLLTLGIGATQAKRWAWALNLILSWIWLIVGTLTTAMLVWVLPGAMLSGMREAAARNANPAAPTTGVMAVILTLMIVFMAIFLIVLPVVFLLFYRSRNVELTCKYRDPVERWTDRRPLPIVGYAIVAAFGAAYYLVLAFTTPLTPFFGRYLTGIPAAAVFIVFALVDAFVSVSFFRMKVAGWWVAIVALSIRLLAALLTIGRGNLLEAYARIGWSQRQLEVLNKNPMFHGAGMLWMMVTFTAVYLGFLIWVRRYFRPTVPPSYTETATAISSSTPTGF